MTNVNGKKSKIKNSETHSDKFRKKLICEMMNMPFDVLHSFLLASENIIDEKLRKMKPSLCPKCFAPYSAGYNQSRLLPHPRKTSVVRTLLRRERTRRASRKDKAMIAALREGQNVFVIRCAKCRYEALQRLQIPAIKKENKPSPQLQEQTNCNRKVEKESMRKRKKKKKKNIPKESLLHPTVRGSKKARVEQTLKTKIKSKKKLLNLDMVSKSTKPNSTEQSLKNKKKFRKLHQLLSLNLSSSNNNPRNLDTFLSTLII